MAVVLESKVREKKEGRRIIESSLKRKEERGEM